MFGFECNSAGHATLSVCVSRDHAGIDREALAAADAFRIGAPNRGFEQLAQQIAVAKTAACFLEKVEWSGTAWFSLTPQNQR